MKDWKLLRDKGKPGRRVVAALMAVMTILAGALISSAAPASATVTSHGAYNYGAIYPANPANASSFTVVTYFDFNDAGSTSERFMGYKVTKTSGPCGILSVVARHTRYPNTTYTFANGASVGSTGDEMAHPNPNWYDWWPSFNVTYDIDTICGHVPVIVAQLA